MRTGMNEPPDFYIRTLFSTSDRVLHTSKTFEDSVRIRFSYYQ